MAQPRHLGRWAGAAAAVWLTLSLVPVRPATQVDFPVALRVEWSKGSRGTAALRDDITQAALEALADRGCFRDVRGAPSGDDSECRLDVVLDDFREETLFDDSLAEQANPGRPDQALRVTAVFSVLVLWDLYGPDGEQVAARQFRIERQRRPLVAGEDPSLYARGEAVEAIARELARTACSVARKKLSRERTSPPR